MTEELQAIIKHYFPLHAVHTEPVPFGLTNTTCFVTVDDQKYVARHYGRYTKSAEGLRLELEVTAFLLGVPLSFHIPSFLPTQNGERYVTLSDGTMGALVTYIHGTAPVLETLNDAQLLGRVVGEISARLSECERLQHRGYDGIPFTDLYRLHSLATVESVSEFWEQPPFQLTDEQKHYYNEAFVSVEANREALLLLPRQLVHHDLLVFNLLSIDGCITGVLDFDFLAVDLSFLEVVISLNHVLQLSRGSLEMASAFIQGYAMFRSCSIEEWRHLRTLTRLYHIAVLHIYIGQYRAGKDIAGAFAYIANQLIERDRWLEQNERHLAPLFAPLLRE